MYSSQRIPQHLLTNNFTKSYVTLFENHFHIETLPHYLLSYEDIEKIDIGNLLTYYDLFRIVLDLHNIQYDRNNKYLTSSYYKMSIMNISQIPNDKGFHKMFSQFIEMSGNQTVCCNIYLNYPIERSVIQTLIFNFQQLIHKIVSYMENRIDLDDLNVLDISDHLSSNNSIPYFADRTRRMNIDCFFINKIIKKLKEIK